MSSIAKIFTVLNVILAAAFLGWAANAVSMNNDYKAKLDKSMADHEVTKKELGTEKSALVAKLKESDEGRLRLQTQLDEAKAESARLDNENKQTAAKVDSLEADYKKIAGTLEGIHTQYEQSHANELKAQQAQHEAETKAKDAAAAQLAAEAKASGLEGDLIAAREEIANKEKSLAEVEKAKRKVDTELATVVAATGFKLENVQAMPLIEGKVLAVEMGVEPGLVSINRGELAKVQRGYTFEIYDGSTYKGQARVEYVYPDMCSAVLVRKVKGETIRQGDGAATRL